jgi:hypothetical protein
MRGREDDTGEVDAQSWGRWCGEVTLVETTTCKNQRRDNVRGGGCPVVDRRCREERVREEPGEEPRRMIPCKKTER